MVILQSQSVAVAEANAEWGRILGDVADVELLRSSIVEQGWTIGKTDTSSAISRQQRTVSLAWHVALDRNCRSRTP